MNETILSKAEALSAYPAYDRASVRRALRQALDALPGKVIVLDDDPTGTQTVHGISVYTDWSQESIGQIFHAPEKKAFILTNSRGMTRDETKAAHAEIARAILGASRKTGIQFLLISRSDSTLRGHYPLETDVLAQTLNQALSQTIDGEILMPFFAEGGRYTIDDVHYVASGDVLTPAGMTEFARDKTFGYQSSNLREWVAEKKGGLDASDVASISLDMLRQRDIDAIRATLDRLQGQQPLIVNAIEYADVEVFATALAQSIADGKRFIIRSAAALPKVLGGIPDKPLLTYEELRDGENANGGLIIAGSHVARTTEQLQLLRKAEIAEYVELDQRLAIDASAFEAETERVRSIAEESMRVGKNVIVATRRERFDLNTGNAEDELRLAVRIASALTGIVQALSIRPRFIVAKGGITSSEIGVKSLNVKKALVLGQILPGVPVWLTGAESKFPSMKYIIFPGNVGEADALCRAVQKLDGK